MNTIPQPTKVRAAQFRALQALGLVPPIARLDWVGMGVRPQPTAPRSAEPSNVTTVIPLDAIPAVTVQGSTWPEHARTAEATEHAPLAGRSFAAPSSSPLTGGDHVR